MGLTLTACTHIYFRSFVLELDATSLFFSIQPLDRPTPAVVCLWPCPNPETNPSTTPIPLTPPISPLPILSTMSTRAWAIATRSLWPPTPTHGLRALAACCRLKARRARMVFRSRYLSVCSCVCLHQPHQKQYWRSFQKWALLILLYTVLLILLLRMQYRGRDISVAVNVNALME